MLGFASETTALRPVHREQLLYFMIRPPHALALEIDRQRRLLGFVSKYPLEQFHITLLPLGDIRALSPEQLELIRSAAASLQAEPVSLVLSRLKKNALAGSNTRALRALQRELVRRLVGLSIPLPDYDFHPHLTLAYGDWQKRSEMVSPLHWRMDALLLVNSTHGEGHKLLGCWELSTRQGMFDFMTPQG
ncbi:2'-5' RNA ligase family protein [Sphingomonas sp. IC-56]|uniref:2'-5' RNA ligase family protein n=1 Tax=Sphingomonas sp. IC-56 TaxID=2898529 RepID=UPI001E3F143B|nr:2'-5' RNA ligase family protein [Sphingomonas sp. IC-56]MCD2323246.1 2'-5' RNA ligase family protein [Sphingomonas sp. IC-56]